MDVLGLDAEHRVRAAAFSFLTDSAERRGSPLVRQDDLSLFTFEGEQFRLMATQTGIWKPRQLNAALNFRTVHVPDPSQRPYDDEEGPTDFFDTSGGTGIQQTPITIPTQTIGPCGPPWNRHCQ